MDERDVDDARFPDVDRIGMWCRRIGSSGLRSTGSAAHSEITATSGASSSTKY